MSNTCSLCNRKSLLIYPARYAVAAPRGAEKVPNFSGTKFRITQAPASIHPAKYALRALREGYLYTYDEKRKIVTGYDVRWNGYLLKYPGGLIDQGDIQTEELEISQMTGACRARGDNRFEGLGRCIDIVHEPTDPAGNLWIGWSNILWNEQKITADIHKEQWRKGHMQCINIPNMVAGAADHTMEFQAAIKYLCQFALKQDELKASFEFSNSGIELCDAQQRYAEIIARAMQGPSKTGKGFVIAVNDPVGLTNDLAELTYPSPSNGFSEDLHRKSMTVTFLHTAEKSIRANAEQQARSSYGISKTIAAQNEYAMANHQELAPDILGLARYVSAAWGGEGNKELRQSSQDIEKTVVEKSDEEWKRVSACIDPYYTSVGKIDNTGKVCVKKTFAEDYAQALKDHQPKLSELTKAHVAWLKSEQLADWMHGIHDSDDIVDGYAYCESFTQCIGKAIGIEECRKVLIAWADQPGFADKRALFKRALVYNNADIASAAESHVTHKNVNYKNMLKVYKESFTKRDNFDNGQKGVDKAQNKLQETINKYKNSSAETDISKIRDAEKELDTAVRKASMKPHLCDRLLLYVADLVVETFRSTTYGFAKLVFQMRLHNMSDGTLYTTEWEKEDLSKWLYNIAKENKLPIRAPNTTVAQTLNTHQNRPVRRAAAAPMGKNLETVRKTEPTVLGFKVDIKAATAEGLIKDEHIDHLQVPGLKTTQRLITSSNGKDFNFGVANLIVQALAWKWASEDAAKHPEDFSIETKYLGSCLSPFFTVIETLGKVLDKFPDFPISRVLLTRLNRYNLFVGEGKLAISPAGIANIGKGLGGVVSLVTALLDFGQFYSNLKDEYYATAILYGASGILGSYLAAITITQAYGWFAAGIPFFWPILISTIVLGLVIASIKPSSLEKWIKRCACSNFPHHYASYEEEARAFSEAIGA